MYRRLSNCLTGFLLREQIISATDYEIYLFGFESIISSVGAILWLLLVGIITDSLIEAAIYYLVLKVLRKYTGGYHASTHIRCMIIYICTYLFLLVLFNLILPDGLSFLDLLTALMWIIISIIALAPVEHPNNRLSEEKKRKHRETAIIITVLLCLIDYALFIFDVNIYSFLLLVVMTVVAYMYVAKIKQNGGKRNENSEESS